MVTDVMEKRVRNCGREGFSCVGREGRLKFSEARDDFSCSCRTVLEEGLQKVSPRAALERGTVSAIPRDLNSES